MSKLRELWEQFKGIFEAELGEVQRRVKEVDSWDGSASRWDTAEAYCNSCLIDWNSAAGSTEKTKGLCHLPVREPGDSTDTYVRQAVHAAAGGRGIGRLTKPDSISQDDFDTSIKAAANKIISAYGEMDETAPDSIYEMAGKTPPERAISVSGLYERVWAKLMEMDHGDNEEMYYAWPVDLYHDNGQMYVIVANRGKLYRYDITMTGDEPSLGMPVEVAIQHVPTGEMNRSTVFRQADGRWRWIGVSATSVLNRVGEIDSRALFDSFVAHAEKTGKYPYRTFYHQGETFRTGQADYLARDGNCYITSGLYDDSELARLEVQARLREPDYWGDSIGFLPESEPVLAEVADGIKIPVYTAGVNREISTLPEAEAASWFTVDRLEVHRMLTGKALEAFVKLFDGDEEKARQWLEQNAETRNRAIEESGMITREVTPEAQPEEPEAAQPVEVTEEDLTALTDMVTRSKVFTTLAEQLQQATEALTKAGEQITTLTGQMDDLNSRVANLETDDDKKRQRWQQDLGKRTKRALSLGSAIRPREERAEDGSGEQVRAEPAVLARLPKY